jgi:hypothetical protein
MKPTELRLGNWINTIEGLTQVKAITEGGIMTTASMPDGDHLEFAEPIPLTEEILLKAGFSGPEKIGKGSSEAVRYYIITFRKDSSGLDLYGSGKNIYITEE